MVNLPDICSLVLDSSLLVCPDEESTSDTPESAGEGGKDPPTEKLNNKMIIGKVIKFENCI